MHSELLHFQVDNILILNLVSYLNNFQVMSRGNVVMAGTVSGSTFSIGVDSKMAPNARIIAYYVRADGEVVTDSISFDVDGAFQNQVSKCTVVYFLINIKHITTSFLTLSVSRRT